MVFFKKARRNKNKNSNQLNRKMALLRPLRKNNDNKGLRCQVTVGGNPGVKLEPPSSWVMPTERNDFFSNDSRPHLNLAYKEMMGVFFFLI